MKVLCAIDIGTNSVRLLVAKVIDGKINPLKQGIRITRLGEGVYKTGRLDNTAIARTIRASNKFVKICRKLKADSIKIIGTSALRDASNRDEFARELKKATGLRLEIISGEREAQLVVSGAMESAKKPARKSVCFDIGGGSTEFIFSNNGKQDFISVNIGCVRLTERFIKTDPPCAEELERMNQFIREKLKKIYAKNNYFRKPLIIGLGGTVTALSAMKLKMRKYIHDKIDGCVIKREDVDKVSRGLQNKTLKERKKITGLEPKRADVIIAGVYILKNIMDIFRCKSITVSDKGILYGLVKENENPLVSPFSKGGKRGIYKCK